MRRTKGGIAVSATIRRWGFAVFTMLSSSLGPAVLAEPTDTYDAWTPTAELITGTERWLRMPAGTRLGDYSRYYYGSVENGRRLLIGTFIRDDRHPGIRVTIKGKVPRVFDGGCYQINVIYDVDAKQTVLIRCNGMA